MSAQKEPVDYLGMPLPGLAQGETPIGAVVLLKVLNAEGEIRYREHRSNDLHWMEALGMATSFMDTCRRALMGTARPGHH